MTYRQLGKSALKVSSLCLGTMNFGPRTPEAEASLILNDALEHGVNFIDTANQYGGASGLGASESIIGRWLVFITVMLGSMMPTRQGRLPDL